MSLSSTSLFHFTRKYEVLLQILENGMWPRYCVEYDWGDKDLIIPMVCTCDIPLSEINVHVNKYGKYAVGLKKGWAKKIGFTPVLYLSDRSKLFCFLSDYAKALNRPLMTKWEGISSETMLYYAKRSVGTDCDREHLRMKLKPIFSNEKEWRYVPDISSSVHMYVATKGKGQDEDLNELSKSTEKIKLKIPIEEIEYLIVETEEERAKLLCDLEEIAKRNTSGGWEPDKLKNLQSRIISMKQVKEDF